MEEGNYKRIFFSRKKTVKIISLLGNHSLMDVL